MFRHFRLLSSRLRQREASASVTQACPRGLGLGVVEQSRHRDDVQGSVELPVAATAESVSCRETGRRFERCDAGE
jgi:hypothetical protein